MVVEVGMAAEEEEEVDSQFAESVEVGTASEIGVAREVMEATSVRLPSLQVESEPIH